MGLFTEQSSGQVITALKTCPYLENCWFLVTCGKLSAQSPLSLFIRNYLKPWGGLPLEDLPSAYSPCIVSSKCIYPSLPPFLPPPSVPLALPSCLPSFLSLDRVSLCSLCLSWNSLCRPSWPLVQRSTQCLCLWSAMIKSLAVLFVCLYSLLFCFIVLKFLCAWIWMSLQPFVSLGVIFGSSSLC